MDRRNVNPGAMHGTSRNRPFPESASEALTQVSKHCSQIGQQKWRSTIVQRYNELQLLLDNDLFWITPDRHGTRLNSIQQLCLAQMLCNYFNEKEKESRSHQYANFETIFCGREGETLLHEVRIGILQKLCSLALQYPCYAIFNLISVWLRKIGNGRSYAQEFVSRLVDQFILGPPSWNLHLYLIPLVEKSEEFVAYFVTYSVTLSTIQSPLIRVLERWLSETEASNILLLIRDNTTIARFFAENTFGNLVVYDCSIGDPCGNALHGVITEIYVDWSDKPALQILPALRAAAQAKLNLNTGLLSYHIHLAQKRGYLNTKDIAAFLESSDMKLRYDFLSGVTT